MRRIVLPLAIAVLVSLSVGLIVGGAVASNAVVVDGRSVTQSQASADLAAAAGSNGYLCYLNASALVRSSGQSGLGAVTGSSTASYSSTFVSNWMNQQITDLIIANKIDQLGLAAQAQSISASAKSDLTASISSTLGQVAGSQYQCPDSASAILSSLPPAFAAKLVQSQADSETLLAHFGGIGLDAQSLEQYYNTSPGSFDTICISGILVASQATAASLRTQLAAGADFATLATQNSTDASKANGGALGCFSPSSANYQSVVKDVGSLAIGAVTQPLPSQNSQYVLLTVTKRTPTPFASIETAVRQAALVADSRAAQSKASQIVRAASVDLNPRYGVWVATAAQTGVIPPASPPTSSILNIKANLPGASG